MASDDPIGHAELPLLYEKRLEHATEIGLAAYCDVHDLIATVSSSTGDVVVYRINGQVAFTIKGRRHDAEVTVLKWKPDGSLLGLGWTDGLCGVYSGEDGRLLSQSSVVDEQEEKDWKLDLAPDFETASQTVEDMGDEGRAATCIGWTAYPSHSKISSEPTIRSEVSPTAKKWFHGVGDDFQNSETDEASRITPVIEELTRSLTTLDVTSVVPQLSAIPSHGARSRTHGRKFACKVGSDRVY